MKLGIGLIIIGTIFLCDATIQLIMVGDLASNPGYIAGPLIKLVIGTVLLFLGIRRVKRKRQSCEAKRRHL